MRLSYEEKVRITNIDRFPGRCRQAVDDRGVVQTAWLGKRDSAEVTFIRVLPRSAPRRLDRAPRIGDVLAIRIDLDGRCCRRHSGGTLTTSSRWTRGGRVSPRATILTTPT